MFGYLGAPRACQDRSAQAEYRRYFCGLCNVLAREYGLPARWLINRDSTALALLWGAQTQESPGLTLTTCCNPWGARHALCQWGPGMSYAAAVTLAGLQSRAADNYVDEQGWARWGWAGLAQAGRSVFTRARRSLDALGFDARAVDRNLAEQSALEQAIAAGGADWRRAAEPTAAVYASLVGYPAVLAGRCESQPRFAKLGLHLGRAIYWLDAIQDWSRDQVSGRFNPLPQAGDGKELLLEELDAAGATLDALPLERYRSLLRDVLIRGPRRQARRLLAGDEGAGTEPVDEGAPSPSRRPQRRRVPGASPGPCEQGCSACGDLCYLSDGCCQVTQCCNDCCDQRGCDCCDCGSGDGCCGSCDCPCDSGGTS